MAGVINNWRARLALFGLVLGLGLALVLAVYARPADAHTHRQLHATIASLRANDAAQARRINRLFDLNALQARQIAALSTRITNLRAVVDEDFVLLACGDDLTWDLLNSEGALTQTYPNLDFCDQAAASSLASKAASARMALERMH
jgi:hypothetical protein